MRIIYILLFSLLNTLTLYALPLTLENLQAEINKSLTYKLDAKNQKFVRQIYSYTQNNPIWITDQNDKKSSALLSALKNPLFNYKNKGFDRKTIKSLFYLLDNNQITPQEQVILLARLDVALTNAFVGLVHFLIQGDVDWALVQKKFNALKQSDDIRVNWEMSPKAMPSAFSLVQTIQNNTIYAYLSAQIPMEVRYKKLIHLLRRYQNMPPFPKVPFLGKTLKIGHSASNIKSIKRRLQISGDYPRSIPINSHFDKALQHAVIRFQKRFLLKVNGIIDSTMFYYLNKPKTELIQSIVTNLDKTKLYPKSFENEYIEVNIPDFRMKYYQNHQEIMNSEIIVGRIDRPTPLFNSAVRYMVLNPTWTIPDNLIKRDLIHVMRENPSYLEENNIHVFSGNKEIQVTQNMLDPYEHSKKRVPYRFVQFPGETNALGRVKFMFPNKYAVYLHDTDNKSLFERRYKIYSSGCMRVQKPFKLMHTLLQHTQGYSPYKLEQIFGSNTPKTIRLNKAIPVHILYFTSYEESGMAYFRHDIYLYDTIIQESAEGFKKATFTIPSKRMISIKKKEDKPLSN